MNEENDHWLQCDDCGKRKPDVEECNCPYVQEMHDEEQLIIVCDDCLYERRMSV